MKVGPSLIGALAAFCIGLSGNGATAAEPTGPAAGYEITKDYTEASPDGSITIEQYMNKSDDYKWQFWVRRQGTFAALDPEPVDYPAGFRFTKDMKWLVRAQKTGSGEQDLYLYRITPKDITPANKKSLSDLAWAYFKTRPEWRKVRKAPEYHISAGLLKGVDDNYSWLKVDWPQNRYLLIGLSGDADVKGRKHEQTGVVNGWRCRYDLESGKFDVPAIFADHNKRAVVPQ